MKKGQGLALGAILVAGLLLRPIGSPAPQQAEPSTTGTGVLPASGPTATGEEGPWVASCKYWAPMRAIEQSPESLPELRDTLAAKGGGFDLSLHVEGANKERDSGCDSDRLKRWGIPHRGTLQFTAIIATVPDPVHGHLALDFDRTVDALLQAAADNEYVSSYCWLPWKNRVGVFKAAESEGNAELGHDPVRERQPGLIVLRHVGDSLLTSQNQVIYVFLVGETPSLGVDGFQLQNAFAEEAELESVLNKDGLELSRGGKNGAVAIVGPAFSGSAASLRAAIETAQEQISNRLGDKEFEVVGTTATNISATVLNQRTPKPNVHYLSFQTNSRYEAEDILPAAFLLLVLTLEGLPCLSKTTQLLGVL